MLISAQATPIAKMAVNKFREPHELNIPKSPIGVRIPPIRKSKPREIHKQGDFRSRKHTSYSFSMRYSLQKITANFST